MAKIDKIKEGDLVVKRSNKKPHIVLEISRYQKRLYGAGGTTTTHRKKFLLLYPDGRQMWKIDTALKVEYYLPGDPWFDDIR
jgi:hypothetical protein